MPGCRPATWARADSCSQPAMTCKLLCTWASTGRTADHWPSGALIVKVMVAAPHPGGAGCSGHLLQLPIDRLQQAHTAPEQEWSNCQACQPPQPAVRVVLHFRVPSCPSCARATTRHVGRDRGTPTTATLEGAVGAVCGGNIYNAPALPS